MSTQNLKIGKGEIFSTATGEYSGYSVNGLFVAIESFDMAEHAQKHVAAKKGGYWDFEAYLVVNLLAMPIIYREIHLGSYSDFHKEFGVPSND